uniref:Uncharacterized protein n=1 Tax=Norrisiella sphaerica TaxID=552664 RepID=A0A7S2QS97_9EUKA|mmetsp:Transcript_159/g.219  ORF Transcript_159/g.219 Transcript_159/m.219 type:complete len:398 (+) Transcript_159:109-1302(+)
MFSVSIFHLRVMGVVTIILLGLPTVIHWIAYIRQRSTLTYKRVVASRLACLTYHSVAFILYTIGLITLLVLPEDCVVFRGVFSTAYYVQKYLMYRFIYAKAVLFDVMDQLPRIRYWTRIWIWYFTFVTTALVIISANTCEIDNAQNSCSMDVGVLYIVSIALSNVGDVVCVLFCIVLLTPQLIFKNDETLHTPRGTVYVKNAATMLVSIFSTVVVMSIKLSQALRTPDQVPKRDFAALDMLDTCINVLSLNCVFPIKYFWNALACPVKKTIVNGIKEIDEVPDQKDPQGDQDSKDSQGYPSLPLRLFSTIPQKAEAAQKGSTGDGLLCGPGTRQGHGKSGALAAESSIEGKCTRAITRPYDSNRAPNPSVMRIPGTQSYQSQSPSCSKSVKSPESLR